MPHWVRRELVDYAGKTGRTVAKTPVKLSQAAQRRLAADRADEADATRRGVILDDGGNEVYLDRGLADSAASGGPRPRGALMFSPPASGGPGARRGLAFSPGSPARSRGPRGALFSPAPGSPAAGAAAAGAGAAPPPSTPESQRIRGGPPPRMEETELIMPESYYRKNLGPTNEKYLEANRMKAIQAAALAEAAKKSTRYGTFDIRGGTRRRRNHHRKNKKHAATHKHKSTNKPKSTSRRRRSHTRVSRRRARGAK